MVADAVERFGRIDVLHNNVGIVVPGGPIEIEEDTWDRVSDINLKSLYLTCKAVLPHMLESGVGRSSTPPPLPAFDIQVSTT